MILSTKLLVATLGVSHFSGVLGSKAERDQLRRNLRQGERKAQFQFAGTDDEGSLDDFFAPEPIADIATPSVDDYFTDTEDGTVFDWEASGVEAEEHAEIDGKAESYGSKSGKGDKIGKQMWDETPMMVKGKKSKTVNGLKAMKGSKGAIFKSRTDSNPKMQDYYAYGNSKSHSMDTADEHGNEEESSEGWLSAFDSSSSLSYTDLFESTSDVQARNSFANPGHVSSGEFVAGGGSTLMTGRAESPEAPTGRMFDDDFFTEEERLVFLPRPTVTLGGSLFSVNPQTVVPPVVPDGSGNTLTLGTEYLFNEVMSNAQDIGSQIVPIDVDNESVLLVVAIDGICDRIGPADQNSVQGYCFFTYTFIDPSSSLTAGSIAAQGIIVNSQVPGQLTVTGGTGIMTGASGLVEILPADVDQNVNPPELVQPAAGNDPFNEIAGWAHFFECDVDVLFFLPELYER